MRDVLEITVEWSGTVIDVHHLGAGERFVLDADTAYGGLDDLLPPDGLTLALVGESGFRVIVPAGASGAHWGEATTPLPADAAQAVTLTEGARVRCDYGPLTFYFARVPAAVHPGKRTFTGVFGDLKSFGSAAVLHALVMIVAIAIPPTKQALSLDRFMGDDRFVDVIMTPSDPVEQQITDAAPGDDDTDGDTPTEPDDEQVAHPEPQRPEPMVRPAPRTREQLKAAARKAAGDIASVLDDELFTGGDPLGKAGQAAIAGMNGMPQGHGGAITGGGGLFEGIGSVDFGGGPKASLRTGKVRATCKDCRTVRTAIGEKQTKRPREPKIIPQKPIIADGLNRDEVMRVIRTKKNQYRTCYEKALQRQRDLEGKIRIAFTVGPDGRVLIAKADENTMGSAEVANCIARRMKMWRFPKPRGGGFVEVRYPFLFRRPG